MPQTRDADQALSALRRIDAPPERVIAALSAGLAGYLEVPCPRPADRLPAVEAVLGDLSPADRSPWLLGRAREALHDDDHRSRLGAWFTPPPVARALVRRAVDRRVTPHRILDPACGGGAFLLAAHERWSEAHLSGIDVDPLAAAAASRALELAGASDVDVRVGDGLEGGSAGYDLILTNPPFLSQLSGRTARSVGRRRQLRAWLGAAAAGYVDDAALFVLAAVRDLAPQGVGLLIVPEAMLATVGSRPVRDVVEATCEVEVVWRDEEGIFPGVPTCAIRLVRRRGPGAPAQRPSAPPEGGRTWSPLLVPDLPTVHLESTRMIGDVATASAEFRDAYYLLADHAAESPHASTCAMWDGCDLECTCGESGPRDPGRVRPGSAHRIVTVGLIDPAHLRWGETPVRFAKQRWTRPVAVDLPAAVVDRHGGPKVLVATQTRVLEALVDPEGDLIPSTPVITVRTDRPWHVGAALTSPVLTAVAARRHAGAARSRGALKLSAAQLLALPLPGGPSTAWDDATEAYRRAHDAADPDDRHRLLLTCAQAMAAAFGIADDPLVRWWADRLPRR